MCHCPLLFWCRFKTRKGLQVQSFFPLYSLPVLLHLNKAWNVGATCPLAPQSWAHLSGVGLVRGCLCGAFSAVPFKRGPFPVAIRGSGPLPRLAFGSRPSPRLPLCLLLATRGCHCVYAVAIVFTRLASCLRSCHGDFGLQHPTARCGWLRSCPRLPAGMWPQSISGATPFLRRDCLNLGFAKVEKRERSTFTEKDALGKNAKCTYPQCPNHASNNRWHIVSTSTNAGGQDWTDLLGQTLCSSCFQQYRIKVRHHECFSSTADFLPAVRHQGARHARFSSTVSMFHSVGCGYSL